MFPAITIAAEINRAVCQSDFQYRPPTAVSVCYEHRARVPVSALISLAPATTSRDASLEWLALGKEALPKARPLSPEERLSINEFFWSHFE
jgi:hypothetical protein